MGCFLGCFGFSSKRKRRKPSNRAQRFLSYEPLDSASANLDKREESIGLDSELNKKSKEPLNCKVRKKVSFNLNVQTYEPIPKEEDSIHFLESDDEEKKEESGKGSAKERQALSLSEAEKMASYPSNYRYRNCVDSYDEEDEIAYEESDLDDEDEDEYDFDGDEIDFLRTSQEDFSEKFKSLSVSRDSLSELTEEKSENLKTNHRSQYVHSVLKPVENLNQWKELKAKVMPLPPLKRQRKENVGLEQRRLKQEIAVDASLSNWLGSKESSLDKMCPWRSREDMPVVDIEQFGGVTMNQVVQLLPTS